MRKTLFKAHLILFGLLACLMAPAGDVETICLAATADLHGNCAQISHLISQQIRRYQILYPKRVIYVDSGDTAQGTGVVNRRRGAGVMTLLAQAGCTVWVPGNHDLEFGVTALSNIIREFPHTVLAANLKIPELGNKIQAWKIIEKSGIRIAFIGLTVNNIEHCFPVDPRRLSCWSEIASLRSAVRECRAAGADIIVLIRHAGKYGGGMNLKALLKNFPEIDLVIGGHSHIADPGSKVGQSWFVQPPAYGRGMAEMILHFDKSRRRLQIVESRIVDLPEFSEKPDSQLPVFPSLKGEKADFTARRMQKYMQSDLALYLIENQSAMAELLALEHPAPEAYYRAYPYFDAVVTVSLTAEELIEILQEYVPYARSRKGLLVSAGFRFESSGGRLCTIGLKEVKHKYRLALSAFAAAGAGGKLPRTRQILLDRVDAESADNAPGILDIVLAQ